MSRPKDLTGLRFGKLVAVGEIERRDNRHVVYKCRCDCGRLCERSTDYLRKVAAGTRGYTGMCSGCGRETSVAAAAKASTKHGQNTRSKRTPTYVSWFHMLQRCLDSNATGFARYGGNPDYPVTVCERWRGEHGFENFLADLGERRAGTSLGRVSPFLGYWPSNCRWETPVEQALSRRKAWLKRYGTPFPELATLEERAQTVQPATLVQCKVAA